MYFDEAKIDILKELSINIAKLYDIYGLVVKDEFLINAAYLQKVTNSIDQLGAVNKKMQEMYRMLANKETYDKEYTCQWGSEYEKDEIDHWVPKVKIVNGLEGLNSEILHVDPKSISTEELKRRNQDVIDEVYDSKWGYNPYEE